MGPPRGHWQPSRPNGKPTGIAQAAAAANPTQAQAGRATVKRDCRNCHVIVTTVRVPQPAGGPDFMFKVTIMITDPKVRPTVTNDQVDQFQEIVFSWPFRPKKNVFTPPPRFLPQPPTARGTSWSHSTRPTARGTSGWRARSRISALTIWVQKNGPTTFKF